MLFNTISSCFGPFAKKKPEKTSFNMRSRRTPVQSSESKPRLLDKKSLSQSQLCAVAFPVKVFFKDQVARIVGVLLEFLTRKDVYAKGIQKYITDIEGVVLFRNKSLYN